jgi:AbrB family looped-hinge helix DNA binding protein
MRTEPRQPQVKETTITGKNQVTLPAEAVRQLGWEKGDRLIVDVIDVGGLKMLTLMQRPENWAETFAGRLGYVFGTHEEVLQYLDEERRSWEEQDEA